MKLKRLFEAIRNRRLCYSLSGKIYHYLESKQRDHQPFARKFIFDDRQHKSENLLLVLMGFQPYFWDVLLDRVNRNIEQFDEDIDVCLCIPCGEDSHAAEMARGMAKQYNFSYLYIYDDLLAQAQNTAINLHPNAQWIYKIDEDILLSDNYFAKMKSTLNRAQNELHYYVGFVSPLINLNAAGFRMFLETINKWDEFASVFPGPRYWAKDPEKDLVHANSKVAEYIWNNSIPFDKVASEIAEKNNGQYAISPIRMSIGAILFTRKKWEEWGMFVVSGIGVMGAEETQICGYTMNRMQVIIIAKDVLAGHWGFYRQKETCRHFFEKHINDIKHK